MTVNELDTFTEAELATIADALTIADAHYRMLAEISTRGHLSNVFQTTFEEQAREAADLRLKIEAGR
jgi:hypothetical protein